MLPMSLRPDFCCSERSPFFAAQSAKKRTPLVRTLSELGHEVVGLDILERPFTTFVGSITDRSCLRRCMIGVQVVFHAATVHMPHIATHSRQDFVDINITGTLNLLEEAVATGVESFIFTSTTGVYGDALVPPAEASNPPKLWPIKKGSPHYEVSRATDIGSYPFPHSPDQDR